MSDASPTRGFALPGLALGVATAATQIEGGNADTNWHRWADQPGRIRDGSSPRRAADHWNRVPQDILLLSELGIRDYRMGLEWARLEPSPGRFDAAATSHYREELTALKDAADESGYAGVSDQLAGDIATLDALDAELAALLKRRQNGYFSDADQIRLQELIDTREAIEVKYRLSPADADGFDTIRQKLEAEVARAQARGKQDADVTVYENAVVAAAQGLAAMNAEIDAQYDKEYALIQLIEDSTERQNAMEALNAKYNENRRNAALEYAALLSDVVPKVWAQADIQQAASDVDTLTQKLREYSAAGETEKPALLEDLSAIAAAMDEGAMTEYLAMLTQIQSLLDSGLSESEIQAMFPEIDFTTALEQIAAIQTFLNNREVELPGLAEMFGDALPEEVLTIATDLDMTGAQERWDAFAADPGAITTDAIIAELREDERGEMLVVEGASGSVIRMRRAEN